MAEVLYDVRYAEQLVRQGKALEFAFDRTEQWLPCFGINIDHDEVGSVLLKILVGPFTSEHVWVAVRAADAFRERRTGVSPREGWQ